MASFAAISTSTSARVAALRPRPTLLATPRVALRSPTPLAAAAVRRARAAVAASAAAVEVAAPAELGEQPISLTPAAMAQLERLRREEGQTEGFLLRMGVRAGGCSGMSYDMKFEEEANVDPDDDTVLEFPMSAAQAAAGGGAGAAAKGGESGAPSSPPPLRVAVDGKSLLFLFGMQVDYSDALVGGGFKFINPQATDTCGCGKSFSA